MGPTLNPCFLPCGLSPDSSSQPSCLGPGPQSKRLCEDRVAQDMGWQEGGVGEANAKPGWFQRPCLVQGLGSPSPR